MWERVGQNFPWMQFELLEQQGNQERLVVGGRALPVRFSHNRAAKRYILRLGPQGLLKLTIPRRGTQAAAIRFAQGHGKWIEQQLQKQASADKQPKGWLLGTEILFRGEKVTLAERAGEAGGILFADQVVAVATVNGDLRFAIEKHLRRLAEREFVPRTLELAALHQLKVRAVSIRNQRTRWGSCSGKGSISLNWRLIQTPPFVADYIILHELMHLREMNHSARFWGRVREVCPRYSEARLWLKGQTLSLR
ncbi:MAG: hypothetical protein JWR19_3274 [Pedosphaera sp.]|nr:hypothetical protein [Pedosphaera sp.]